MKRLLFVALLGISALASAHELTAEECPFYAGAVHFITEQRNAGKSVVDTQQDVMAGLAACHEKMGDKCPVKDGQDTERVLNFIKMTYALQIPEGKDIDVDATTAANEAACVAHAMRGSTPPPMTPDPSVPHSGPQIEG